MGAIGNLLPCLGVQRDTGVGYRLRVSVREAASNRCIPRHRPDHCVLRSVMERTVHLKLGESYRQN